MKNYLVILLGVAASIVLCFIAVSAIIDPFSILHPLRGTYYFEPNSRVPKVDFLLRNCQQYDAYFVGDSRSATLSTSDLPDSAGRNFYNLSTPADDVVSIVRRLTFLIDNGCRLRSLVINESADVLLEQDSKRGRSSSQSESPAVSGESRLAFYARYFLSAHALTTYFRVIGWRPVAHAMFYPDGHADYLWGMKSAPPFEMQCPAHKPRVGEMRPLFGKLPGYRELADLGVKHGFNVVVWVAPLSAGRTELFDDPDVESFLEQLEAIHGLSVVRPIRDSPALADFRQWHDCGHFRHTLFDQLVAGQVSKLLIL